MMIFGSPSRYVQGSGVIDQVGQEVGRLGRAVIVLADRVVADLLGNRIDASFIAADLEPRWLEFGGEITPREIDRLANNADHAEVVVAIGGGKCIDAGKGLAHRLNARLVTAPTIASNDAPTSHVYVLYDERHRLLRVDKLPANPDIVLVDTAIIAAAPAQFLVAGIGDAIVKSFEAFQCRQSHGKNVYGARPPLAAQILADNAYTTLRSKAVSALSAVEANAVTDDLDAVVEACVLWSGLAFESGGLSLTHSMTRGLSAIEPVASAAHGFQVAYALLVQLYLEDRSDAFIEDIRAFFREIGLPCKLADMGLMEPTLADFTTIAEATLSAPHARNFTRQLTADDIVAAAKRIEARL
jgi:glycerol dehydrogenase